jgi:AmmeMemoRadiSam system protein B/AmmeMemoRadiSam system protein A
MPSIRPAAVAGYFYPAHPDTLREQVQRLLEEAAPPPRGQRPPKMLVVPHAGYAYSGAIAARAYARLIPWRKTVRRVVLLGPVHRVPLRGLAAAESSAFQTPLGEVPVDRGAIADLRALPHVVCDDVPHALEHSLEVQLPFLQAVLDPGFSVVPLLVGEAAPEQVAEALQALWSDDDTVVVVSTDLSHYLAYAQACVRDQATIARVLSLEVDVQPHEACGARALNGALLMARRVRLLPQLLDLRNSGDTAGDPARVVGYASMVFESEPPATDDESIDDELGAALLAAARNAVARRLGLPEVPEPRHRALARPGATFVTLHDIAGELRGCKGRISPDRPLLEDVRSNAQAAAFDDWRFTPVTASEWDQLRFEVSLLGPLQPLAVTSEAQALAALRPGVDGLVLRWRAHQATLLPSVWEQLPSPQAFLTALKRKAGLRSEFWSDELRLLRFSARKFMENDR